MGPGVLQVARRHDPFSVAGAPERDRQSVLLAARLERRAEIATNAVKLRGAFSLPFTPASAPFHLAGALENSRELECLTQAVYFEARGEGPSGQAAVAQVVLNRVRHPAFPKSVCAVVFQGAGRSQGCQFSFACDGSMRRSREYAAWGRAQRIAERALAGAVMAGVGDATHFHTVNVAPTWGPHLLRVAEIGLHVFYRFGRGAGTNVYIADSRVRSRSPSAPAEPQAPTADFRLTSAVLMTSPSEAGAEPASTATEPKSAPAQAADAPALTPVSQPNDGAVKGLGGAVS